MYMPKIGIVSTDWSQTITDAAGHPEPGGAGWVRLQQLRPHWSFQSVTGNLLFNEKKGFSIVDFDGMVHSNCGVIIMQRLMFEDLIEKIKYVKSMSPRPLIVNDVDDWYWGLDERNAAFSIVQPGNNPTENIDHYAEILRLSDVITVSTPFLRDKMSSWLGHPNVVMIENCVTTADFRPRSLRTMKPIIGWVGSTMHRSGDLEELRGLFSSVDRLHHSGHVDGAPLFADRVKAPRSRVSVSPMYPPRQYAKHAFCFDIGIAPLSDQPFNHAKSWIKMIEYAAAGVPAIGSPAPEYLRLHSEYGIGRIAHSLKEWREHIDELGNHRLRAAEARSMHNAVSALDVSVMAAKWTSLIRDAVA